MKIFSSYSSDGFWWFRVFGVGFSGKETTKNFLTFSERYGYTKYIRIGNWIITIIK